MQHKIILDVDTGHDDMIAIVMASGLPQIEVMGIVAVAGNQVLEKTLLNTLHVCDLIGQDAPVFAAVTPINSKLSLVIYTVKVV